MISRSLSLALSAVLVPAALATTGCGANPEATAGDGESQNEAANASAAAASVASDSADSESPDAKKKGGEMSADFRAWLSANGYDSYDFPRDDVQGGSFGGRTKAGQALTHTPVVFVHGNSDKALGTTSPYTGWTASVKYFTSHGYAMDELYATTWGPADELQTANQEHSRANILGLRTFLQAVLKYTGAAKVDVIAHSMGVTMARGAILGGKQVDSKGSYSLGPSLGAQVDTFVGISGGNLGLSTCYWYSTTDTCSAVDGFYPGALEFGSVSGIATFLGKLNAAAGGEGSYRFAIYSQIDEVIGGNDLVWGEPTSRIPGETGEITYATAPYGHVGVKDLTGAVQYALVTKHKAAGLTKP